MKVFFPVRSLRATATIVLTSGLASCSRGPEASAAAPASTSTQASALAPVPTLTQPRLAASSRADRATAQASASPALRSAEPVAAAPEITVATAPPATPKPTMATASAAARVATYTQAGRVLDESGQPLVGATVLLRGSTHGTSTDATGGYMLEVPKGENTFVIGYAGYADETASSHDGQPLTVTLLPAPAASPGPPAKGRRGRR